MPKIDMTNDGPSTKFQKKDQVKLVLDMSNNGPMFKMLEQMAGAGGKGGAANEALKKLLKSGIPRLEGLLAGGGDECYSVFFSGFFRRFRRLTRRNSELDKDFG